MSRLHLHPVVINLFWVALALLDSLLFLSQGSQFQVLLAVVGALGLFLRDRWPWLALLLALPVSYFGAVSVAGLVALYTVARHASHRGHIVAAGVLFLGISASSWWEAAGTEETIVAVIYTLLSTATPIALGLLAQTRAELTAKLEELDRAKEAERQQHEAQVLATERARIAREMHDVVSHQVSLIAVQAGALQVGEGSPKTKDTAKTIRTLAVRTLDELRDMVTVLRASAGSTAQLTPQPTVADLDELIAASGLPVTLTSSLPDDLPATLQRAIFRTVQEGLTNVRKHAPGARVTVTAQASHGWIEVSVANTAPVEPAPDLPSSGHGLVGLRERAELLGGSLESCLDKNDAHTLVLRLPYPDGCA